MPDPEQKQSLKYFPFDQVSLKIWLNTVADLSRKTSNYINFSFIL